MKAALHLMHLFLAGLNRRQSLFLTAAALSVAATSAQVIPISEQQAQESGAGHPWQASNEGVNLYSLARHTEVPIMEWHSRGDLSAHFALYHNSKAVYSNPAIGSKWSHSYDTHIDFWVDPISGNPTAGVVWGDHTLHRFVYNGSQWENQDGYRESLMPNGPGFQLKTKSGLRYEFEPSLVTGRYRLFAIVDRSGNGLSFSYDPQGRLAQFSDPNGRAILLSYAPNGEMNQVRFVAGALSRTWNLFYLAGRLRDLNYPPVTTDSGIQNYQMQFSYDGNSNLTLSRDPSGANWHYTYDPNSRLTSAQWPGSPFPVQYQKAGAVVTVSDPVGNQNRYEYDALGRLIKMRDGLGATMTFLYNNVNYSWALSRARLASGLYQDYTYDSRGNLLSYRDLAGFKTDFTYDSENRLTQIQEPLVTNAWDVVESARHKTRFYYDSLGRLSSVRQYTDAVNYYLTRFSYDATGNITRITNPLNNVTRYTYDTYGNITKVTSPALRTEIWKYADALKTFGFTQPEARTNGIGQQTKFVYDEWGRMRKRDFPTGIDTTYSYDALGRLTRMVDSTGTVNRMYSPAGWLLSETVTQGAITHQRLYDYYPNGLRSILTESGGAVSRTLNYTYDAASRLTRLNDDGLITHFVYDMDDRLIARSQANGASAQFAYTAGRLTTETYFDGAAAITHMFQYAYQANGQLSRAQDPLGITRYQYDFLNRPIREERVGAAPYDCLWTYDGVGNRLSQNQSGVMTTYSYDMDNLLTQTVTGANPPDTYLWDAGMRLAECWRAGAGNRFAYDYEDRLTGIQVWTGAAWAQQYDYQYDGLDRRVRRQVFDPTNGTLTNSILYGYDGNHVIREMVSDAHLGNFYLTNTWAHGLLSFQHSLQGRLWNVTDLMGSLRGTTLFNGQMGPQGAIYNLFGNPAQFGFMNPVGFAADGGILNEGDAGMLFTGSVWFMPDVGLNLCNNNGGNKDDKDGFFGKLLKKIRLGITVAEKGARGGGTVAGWLGDKAGKAGALGGKLKAAGPVLQKAGVVVDAVQSGRLIKDAVQDPDKANDKAAAGDYGATIQGYNMIGKAIIGDWKGIEQGAKNNFLGRAGLRFGTWLGNKIYGK